MSDKRVALVTGADKSIGLEAVRGLAQLGITVYLTSRNEETGRAAAESVEIPPELESEYGRVAAAAEKILSDSERRGQFTDFRHEAIRV